MLVYFGETLYHVIYQKALSCGTFDCWHPPTRTNLSVTTGNLHLPSYIQQDYCLFLQRAFVVCLAFHLSAYLKKSRNAPINWCAHIRNNVRGSAWARNIQRRWSQRNSNQLHRASESHWPVSGIIYQKAYHWHANVNSTRTCRSWMLSHNWYWYSVI